MADLPLPFHDLMVTHVLTKGRMQFAGSPFLYHLFNDIRAQFIFFSLRVRSFGLWCRFAVWDQSSGYVTEKCRNQKNAHIHSIPVVIHKEEVAKAEKTSRLSGSWDILRAA